MAANGIPGIEPLGESHETLRFFVGIAVYLVALGALVVYLIYKLPRDESGSETIESEPETDESEGE